jgi:hypothetical protein
MRALSACAIATLAVCACRSSARTEQRSVLTGPATPKGLESAFAGVLPASAPPFVAEGPITLRPGFARRSYRSDRRRVEITVAAMGQEAGAYERWVASSLDYPQAPLPSSDANGFFTCAASDSPVPGCDLHIQTRSGFHVEVMGDGRVPRNDLVALVSHLRFADLSDSFPPRW